MQFLAFLIFILAVFTIYRGAVLLLQRESEVGIKRLAYAISGLWIGLPLLLIWVQSGWNMEFVSRQAWMAWVLLAVLPNILFWTLIWILKGFQKND